MSSICHSALHFVTCDKLCATRFLHLAGRKYFGPFQLPHSRLFASYIFQIILSVAFSIALLLMEIQGVGGVEMSCGGLLLILDTE